MGFFDGLGGGLLDFGGGILSYLGQEEANRSNKMMAQDQRNWQTWMEETKYPRQVQSLKDAGLNPMMAFGNMGGSSPSGAVGFAAQNSLGSAVEAFNRGRSASADVGLKKEQEDTQKATTLATLASADKTKQDERTSKAQELNAIEDAKLKASTARLNSANEAKTRAETSFIDAQRAEVAAKQPGWNIIQGVMQKVKDISENSTAQNLKRMRENLQSLPGRPGRSIEIIGNPGVFNK